MKVRWTKYIPPPPWWESMSAAEQEYMAKHDHFTVEGEVIGVRSGFLGLGSILVVATQNGIEEVGAQDVEVVPAAP